MFANIFKIPNIYIFLYLLLLAYKINYGSYIKYDCTKIDLNSFTYGMFLSMQTYDLYCICNSVPAKCIKNKINADSNIINKDYKTKELTCGYNMIISILNIISFLFITNIFCKAETSLIYNLIISTICIVNQYSTQYSMIHLIKNIYGSRQTIKPLILTIMMSGIGIFLYKYISYDSYTSIMLGSYGISQTIVCLYILFI